MLESGSWGHSVLQTPALVACQLSLLFVMHVMLTDILSFFLDFLLKIGLR